MASLVVCLLLNGTSALFRLLVPRTGEIKQTGHDTIDLDQISSSC